MPDVLDLLGVWIGVLLTLLVFSYLLHDSPLFRIAQAIFVGVTVGYAATVAIRSVLVDRLFKPLLTIDLDRSWVLLIPLILGLLLFTKWRAAWASIGNIPIAFLFGVGSALAIGGAISGTLWPQIQATMVSLSPDLGLGAINNFLLAVGTIGAFLSFRFIVPSPTRAPVRAVDVIARGWSVVGRWFIYIAFGAIFADTAVSRVSILVSRFYYVLQAFGVK